MQRVSFNPDTFQAGGLPTNVDVVVIKATAEWFDYGKGIPPAAALMVTVQCSATGEVYEPQSYTIGDGWSPLSTADGFIPSVGSSKTAINPNSNAGVFLKSLKDVGVPSSLLDSGYTTSLVGIGFRMVRKPVKELGIVDNSTPKTDAKGRVREREIAIATKLNFLPGETANMPAAVPPPTQQAAPPVPAAPASPTAPPPPPAGIPQAAAPEGESTVIPGVPDAIVTIAANLIKTKIEDYKGKTPQASKTTLMGQLLAPNSGVPANFRNGLLGGLDNPTFQILSGLVVGPAGTF